jgi:hypothetical protein
MVYGLGASASDSTQVLQIYTFFIFPPFFQNSLVASASDSIQVLRIYTFAYTYMKYTRMHIKYVCVRACKKKKKNTPAVTVALGFFSPLIVLSD